MEIVDLNASYDLTFNVFCVKRALNKLKYCSKFSNLTASRKTGWFHGKAAVAQLGRAADSERHRPFEAEAVNQLVVGSSPTGGAISPKSYSANFFLTTPAFFLS